MEQGQIREQKPCIKSPYKFFCKNRQRGESLFKVHFSLKNVYIAKQDLLQEFLEAIRERISKIGTPQVVQILNIVDEKHVDLAIGMKFDFQVLNYLHHGVKKIFLKDELGNLKEITPIVFDMYYQYMNKQGKPSIYDSQAMFFEKKIKQEQIEKQKLIEEEQKKKQEAQRKAEEQIKKAEIPKMKVEKHIDYTINTNNNKRYEQKNSNYYTKTNPVQRKKQRSYSRDYYRSRSRSRNDRRRKQQQDYNRRDRDQEERNRLPIILLLGIPIHLNYLDIDDSLYEDGIQVEYMSWKFEQKMQYLEVQPKKLEHQKKLQSSTLKIKGYPIIAVTYRSNTRVINQLKDFEVRVQLRNRVDQSCLFEYFSKFGNIILMLAEDESLISYLIVYNSREAAKRCLATSSQQLIVNQPRNPIALKRLTKEQSFSSVWQPKSEYRDNKKGYQNTRNNHHDKYY